MIEIIQYSILIICIAIIILYFQANSERAKRFNKAMLKNQQIQTLYDQLHEIEFSDKPENITRKLELRKQIGLD